MRLFWKIFDLYMLCILSVTLVSCVKPGSDESEREKDLLEKSDNIIYHNANDPGKWEDEVIDHVPVSSIDYGKEFKTIKVEIAFPGSMDPLHYVEAIILMDHNRHELQKVTFNKGNARATAFFKLPRDYKSFVYIVSKCNLHGMWEKQIIWDK